jgi:ligand-binding SRPBCC domain-containing protein
MLPIFRLGLGGPVGSGDQYVPWIHLEDLVEMMVVAITDNRYDGIYNATGPEPVTFRRLAKSMGSALARPSVLPAPSFAVRALFGEAADVLLNGQRAIPQAVQALGFQHRFQTVEAAVTDLLDNRSVSIEPITGPIPESDYLKKHRPIYKLETRTVFDRPIDEVLPFFSRPENLGLITPAGMQFRITRMPESLGKGAEIDYRLKVGPVPIRWRTRIDDWVDGERFVDSQLKGPYASWWHEHAFVERNGQTIMTDRVFYAPPAGPLGRIANAVFIADELRGVFGYRASVMRLRFGASA